MFHKVHGREQNVPGVFLESSVHVPESIVQVVGCVLLCWFEF